MYSPVPNLFSLVQILSSPSPPSFSRRLFFLSLPHAFPCLRGNHFSFEKASRSIKPGGGRESRSLRSNGQRDGSNLMSPRPGSGLPDSLPAVGGRRRVEIYLVEHFFLDILREGIIIFLGREWEWWKGT